MNTPRAVLIMFAGLAGGIGGRLALGGSGKTAKARGAWTGNAVTHAEKAAADTAQPHARPSEAAILEATGGPRLRLLMAWLPEADGEAMQRMAEKFANPGEYLALRLLMTRWAEVDAPGMLAWTRMRSQGHYNTSWYVADAIEAWARVDFDHAWAAACAGQPGTRGSALLGLATMDPDKCLQFLRGHPELLSFTGTVDVSDVLRRLAKRYPYAAAALLDGGTDAQRRKLAGDISIAWAKSDPAAATEWLGKLDPATRAAALEEEAGEWFAKHAPDQLPALLEGVPQGRTRRIIEGAAFGQLASTDPVAAQRQLDAMPTGPARQHGRGLLMNELFRRGDNAGAVALAAQLGWRAHSEWDPSYTEVVTASSSSSGDNGAEEPAQKTMQQLLGHIAQNDPQQAAGILTELRPGDGDSLLSGERESNPGAIAEALKADAGEPAAKLLDYLLKNWAYQAPEAAATWALTYDTYVSSVLEHWRSDPGAALAWADKLPGGKREAILLDTVKTWSRNPVGMDVPAVIRQSALPELEKQKLIEALPSQK